MHTLGTGVGVFVGNFREAVLLDIGSRGETVQQSHKQACAVSGARNSHTDAQVTIST